MNTIVIALSTVIVYAAYRFGRFSAKMDIKRKGMDVIKGYGHISDLGVSPNSKVEAFTGSLDYRMDKRYVKVSDAKRGIDQGQIRSVIPHTNYSEPIVCDLKIAIDRVRKAVNKHG